MELDIGPYAGELWIDQNTRLDVVELIPGTVATCLRISSTGRRIAVQSIAGPGIIAPTVAVASAYARALVEAVSLGVHKEYVPLTVTSDRPRGKLDIGRTIRGPWAAGRPEHVVTRRRDLSDDNVLNRALLAACLEAEWRLATRPEDLRLVRSASSALRGAALDRTAKVPPSEGAPSRFRTPLALARDLLEGVATSTGGRDHLGHHSAWVNVERVFEEAVRTIFGRLFDGVVSRGEDERVPLFQALPSDPPSISKTANPDVILRGSRGVAIVDAKYRRSGEDPTDDAIYQLIAHAGAFGARAAALVTPALYQSPQIRRLGRTADGCAIDVVSVNSGSERELNRSVSQWLSQLSDAIN